MKIGIVFYSFSGNTKTVCLFLKRQAEKMGHSADIIELKPIDEERSFLKQCRQAVLKIEVELANVTYDLAAYDFIIFASPVWAFTIAPALKVYLGRAKNFVGKKAACIVTYGSGVGSQRALIELKNIIANKQAHAYFSFRLPGIKIKEPQFLQGAFKSLWDNINRPCSSTG